MEGWRVVKFSGAFYLRTTVIGVLLWVVLNLLTGNPLLQGHYYVPVFLLLFLFFQFTYRLEVRPDAIILSRLGMSSKVGLDKLQRHEQVKGNIWLYLTNGARHKIPVARFNPYDQTFLQNALSVVTETRLVEPEAPESAETQEVQPSEDVWSDAGQLSTKQIKAEIETLLAAGHSRKSVYERLKGRGLNNAKLAYQIASTPDAMLCALHDTKTNVLIWIVIIQTVLALLGMLVAVEPDEFIWVAAYVVGINALFIWGFYVQRLLAYSVFILLNAIFLPRDLITSLIAQDYVGAAATMVAVATAAYAWYVRRKLFPHIALFGPKKDKQGDYPFAE